jgi:aryl-alcohol dehydrogenase-like predicted oxidoreductase
VASWGEQDDGDTVAMLHAAVEAGITWIDTAAVYGLGHAERVVGRALAGLPGHARPLVFTKCGLVWGDDPRQVPLHTLAPASIRRECEASLRRLGVDRLDLYQIHWPSMDGTPVEDGWATMADLVDEGKVRWIGVSNFDVDLLERCERIRHVDSLQPPLSLLDRRALSHLLPWCQRHGTGVLAYSPLASGLLTGRFSRGRLATLDPEDWRREAPPFRDPDLGRALALVDRLRPIAREAGCSLPELALAWVLSCPGVTAAIVGARDPGQLTGVLEAPSVRLAPGLLDRIATAVAETGAGTGPAAARASTGTGGGQASATARKASSTWTQPRS